MSDRFRERLNLILPKLCSADFLTNKGLGNEIGFWVFDYPPEQEMAMRDFITGVLLPGLGKQQPALRPAVVNLFELILELLEDRNLYDREQSRSDGCRYTSNGATKPSATCRRWPSNVNGRNDSLYFAMAALEGY